MKVFSVAAVIVAGLGVQGCATKKYVRNTVDPVRQQVAGVDKRTGENTARIEEADRNLSQTRERLSDVDRKTGEAMNAAQQAGTAAQQAGQRADQAQQLASTANTRVEQLSTDVNTKLENIDKFGEVNNQSVLFKLNSATLSKEGKEQLDQLASQVQGLNRYVIEVQGFTDKTGNAQANLDLSERRAGAVVRYLTQDKQIPLRNIRMIGQGAVMVAASDNGEKMSRRELRKQSRRVEVRVYGPNGTGAAPTTTGARTPTSTGTN